MSVSIQTSLNFSDFFVQILVSVEVSSELPGNVQKDGLNLLFISKNIHFTSQNTNFMTQQSCRTQGTIL